MFTPTSPHLSLTRVLPFIGEEAFRSWFSADNGRPNASIRMLVGLHLLKEADDRAAAVFGQLTAALMKADGLSAVGQRLDSTHVILNIAVLTRLGPFAETVTNFLPDLQP